MEKVNLMKQRSYYLAKWENLDPLTQIEEMTNIYRELTKVTQKLDKITKIR